MNDAGCEGFLGEAAVVLLCERSENWVRALVAGSAMGYYYSSTRLTLEAAFRLRKRLGDEFPRLLNLTVLWAGLRRLLEHCSQRRIDPGILRIHHERLFDQYVRGQLRSSMIPIDKTARIFAKILVRVERRYAPEWRRVEVSSAAQDPQRDREVPRGDPGLDVEVIEAAFAFLPRLTDSADDEERSRLIDYHRQLLNIVLGMMPELESPEQEIDGTPYEFERWVFARIADLVPQLTAGENPRSFWQPILDLGPAAHYWIEDYLQEWFTTGLRSAGDLEAFAKLWKEMVLYSFESPIWKPETLRLTYDLQNLATEIMGLGMTLQVVGGENFSEAIQSMAPLFEEWAKRWLAYPAVACRFAALLSTTAGTTLLSMGIKQLAGAIDHYSESDWRPNHFDETLAEALQSCWRKAHGQMDTDLDLKRAFVGLLNVLCKRLNPEALELRRQFTASRPL